MRISPFAASYIRKRAAELMVDACKIWTPGDITVDPVTGRAQRVQGATKYEGPCRVWEVNAGPQIVLGERQFTSSQTYLSLPFNSPIPEADDVVLITASVDYDLVGRVVNIVSIVRGGGLRASRKFQVQVVESTKAAW